MQENRLAAWCRAAVLLAFGAATAACGGGGGGGGAPPAPASPPPAVPPPPLPTGQLLALDQSNAEDALTLVLGALDHAVAAAEVAQLSLDIWQAKPKRLQFCGVATTYSANTVLVDRDVDGRLSSGDAVNVENQSCPGLAHTIDLTIASADNTAGTAAGQILFTGSRNGETVVSGNGSFTRRANGPESALAVSGLSFTFTQSGQTHELSGVTIGKTMVQGSLYEIGFSGTLVSNSLGGRITFAVDEPLTGQLQGRPFRGALSLAGSNSRIRVGAQYGAPLAAVTLETSGAPIRLDSDWTDLLDGFMFGLSPAGPIITTSLRILPLYPRSFHELRADFSVIDFPFDPALGEYEWRRNGVVIPGATGRFLPISLHDKDDLIELTARARDGSTEIELTAATRIVNSLPVIADTAIAPSLAYTSDALRFAVSISDPDGDPLDVRHEWRRNGQIIAGQQGGVLPSSEHRRDDVISVSVTVNDGTDLVVAEAQTTILDSPPSVAIDPPESTVGFGETVQLAARFIDLDDDPVEDVPLRLAFGPSGMQVDSANHTVSWTANEPMFSDTLDVRFGVAVDTPSGATTSAILHLADPGRGDALARSGLHGPADNNRLIVDDFDGDGDVEMLILADILYELAFDQASGSYAQTWAYPFALDRHWALATGDADGDGRHEIYLAAGDRLYQLDGATRRLVRSIPLEENCSDLEYADLASDGVGHEVVCSFTVWSGMTSLGVSHLVLDAVDLRELHRTPPGPYALSFEIANADGDPAKELLTWGGFAIDGVSFLPVPGLVPSAASKHAFGDVDGDGSAEAFCVCGTVVSGFRGGTEFWTVPFANNALGIADLDGDGDMEVLAEFNSGLRAYDFPADGDPVVAVEFSDAWSSVRVLDAGDFDGDGTTEIIATGAPGDLGRFLVFSGDSATEEWRNDQSHALFGAFSDAEPAYSGSFAAQTVFFLTNAGIPAQSMRLIGMSPEDGSLGTNESLLDDGHSIAGMVVTDYDGDDYGEAFISVGERLLAYDLQDRAADWSETGLARRVAGIADFDGDGDGDPVVTGSNSIDIIDIWEDRTIWSGITTAGIVDVKVGDIDANGSVDVVVLTTAGIDAYEMTGPGQFAITRRYMRGTELTSDIEIGDLDGDGLAEVVALSRRNSFDYQLRLFDSSLRQTGLSDLDFAPTDIIIERTPHARKNVLLTVVEEGSLVTYDGTVIVAVDPATGAEIWRSPALLGVPANDSVEYLDAGSGGRRRIAIGTRMGMFISR